MEIRRATANDLDQILELFTNTVKHINAKDYAPEQIEVWSKAKERSIWLEKFQAQSFFVAISHDEVTGFSSIDPDGYLDFMYVHKDHQRKGIAQALLSEIEKQAEEYKVDRIWASVSITAQPFFQKHGYRHYEDEHKLVGGVPFKNALMEKVLGD